MSKLDRMAFAAGYLVRILLFEPPLILWALGVCGLPLGITWKTWAAVAILACVVRAPFATRTVRWDSQ